MLLSAGIVGGIVKHKIATIGESPLNDDGSIQGSDDDALIHKVHPGIMDSVALLGIGGSLLTMVLTNGLVVDAASVMTMTMTPFCAYQKRELNELGGMRGQQNQLRQSVNQLQTENNILTTSVDQLELNVNQLEHVESALTDIAKAANTDCNRLVKIVTEMSILQDKIKLNLEREVMQNVLEALVQSDSNQDFSLNLGEKEMLILRLSNLPGIVFDDDNFRKMVGDKDLNISHLMQMLRNLMDDGIPENDNIFHLKPAFMLEPKKAV